MNTDGSPLKTKIIPARNAAKKASSSFSRQLDDSSVNSDDEIERPSRRRRGRGRGGGRGGGSQRGRGKSVASMPSTSARPHSLGEFAPESSTARRPHSSIASPSKRKRSFSFSTLSDGDESPLTSVPATPVKQSTSFHNAKRSEAKALTRSWSSTSKLSTSFERPWSLDGLGNYVWVLVSGAGIVFQEEDEQEYVWWPAKKHHLAGHRLTLIPFGDLNPRLTRITVEHPCSENILSLTDSLGRNRFNEPIFSPPSVIGDLDGSPRKKRKTERGDMRSRWQAALHKMLEEKEEEEDQDDNLPDIAFALSVRGTHASASGSPSRRKTQARTSISDTDEAEDLNLWDVPSADLGLEIPGELVLAREKADLNLSYWPGKVLEYVPPVSRIQKAGKYKVLYLDGATRTIPRTWFHCLGDKEFGTCKLGEFESTAVNNSDGNDENSMMGMGQPHDRGPSPVPSFPPPSSTDFIYLSIRQQFCYTKPILQAVLNEAYPPTMEAHDMFMAGGKARKILNQNAGQRGTVTPDDVERLTHFLLSWALRGEMVAKRITGDGVEVTTTEDTEAPQNNPDVVDEGPRDTGTTVGGITNAASHNVDDKETSVVDHEADSKLPTSLAEEGPLKPSSALSIIVQDGEALPASSQRASQALTVRAKSPGSAEPFVTSPSEEPTPSSLAPSTGEVDMEEPEEDLEGRQTPRHGNSQYTDIEAPPTDLIDQRILHTTEETFNGDTVVERDGESTPANVANETYDGPPRQVGCERYEALSQLEKFEYCQNVLLPEAILQILLWKEGARTSVELLSDDEEQRLHEQGEVLRRKTDWVLDVMHLRNQITKALKRKVGKSKLEKVGGTRTRPMYKTV
ncbi:hypothetical protein EDD18DRAFT_179699 [Armillaria luteobubalina]|uniref:Uncharacterized protein n=1 Tax=Armillaria luteobubalina TaxID=153913 RepID=A0AA39Q632_9AGAR|nr:hypothetical protein EDD18DRAFT_179699 [Armillaria luteobubalina]